MASRGLPYFLRSIVTEMVVFAAAAAGILAFAAPLVGWALALSVFANIVLVGVAVALAIYVRARRAVALAIPAVPSKPVPADGEGERRLGAIELRLPYRPPPRTRRPTILDRIGRFFYQDYIRLRVQNDLEGEVNRRATKILLLGGRAAAELRRMMHELPRKQSDSPVKRGMTVSAVELAHQLPDPLDVHAFTSARLELYEREADERYGFRAR